jgi:hypothetical protein
MIPKLVIKEVGMEMAVIIVLRTLKRKMNMIPAASNPPIRTSYWTSEIASSINFEESKEIPISTP